MSRFIFEDFDFDTQSYGLTQKGAPVTLRPKTAKLLSLFLTNHGNVLSKTELITAVWGNHHVPEYALHQLVSELRKLSKGKPLIRTQPNQGYCWIAQTKFVEDECQPAYSKSIIPRLLRRFAVPVTVAACVVVGFVVWPLNIGGLEPSSLPGIRALTKGIIALEEGDQEDATAWFEFVLAENPQANEARLLLAESLLRQNRLEEASAYLYPMLAATGDTTLGASEYEKIAATELLSRIHQHSGQYFEALQFARRSFFESRAQCTLEYLGDRVRELASLTGEEGHDKALSSEREFSQLGSTQAPGYHKFCQRLKGKPDQDEASIHLSSPASQPRWAIQTAAGREWAGGSPNAGGLFLDV